MERLVRRSSGRSRRSIAPLALALLLWPAAASGADDEDAPDRIPRSRPEVLRVVAPWWFVRVDAPTLGTAGIPQPPIATPRDRARAGDEVGRRLRLSPAEALEVRVASGAEPPRVTREQVLASAFAPTALSLPAFAELPGGIVFGTSATWPGERVPAHVRLDAGGALVARFADGTEQRFARVAAADLLACLEQARATPGADALVSVTRAGRAQLSAPFARADAGLALARADLAPFGHLGAGVADKSVVLDARARVVATAAGELVPLADLELRLYRAADDDGWFAATEERLAAREPAAARLARTLHFVAEAREDGALALDFALQEPDWWRTPPAGTLTALEADLAVAARLAAWTATFRALGEHGTEGLDALARELAARSALEQRDERTPPPLR